MAGPVPYAGSPDYQKKKSKKKKSSGNSGKGGIFGGIANSGGGFNVGQPAQQAGNLAMLIEKQAAAQKAQAQASSGLLGQTNPYQSIQDQLFAAINGVQAQTTPLEQLRQMATQQVSAQFDPQIAALSGQITSKSKRGARSEKQARQMYGDLSKDFLSQLPDMTAQFAAEDKSTNARYDQAQQQMQGEYDKQASEQDAVLKRLGVQAASQDASQQSKDDQAYFQNQAELDQQNAMTAQDQQQNAATNYQRDMGSNAQMAGENTAQDIHQQLSDYLDQANGQMGALTSQKQSGIAALLSQMQAQDQQNAQSNRQKEIDNLMSMFNFQLSAQKAGDSAAAKGIMGGIGGGGAQGTGGSSLFKGTTGLQGATNYLAEQYPDQPILAKNLMTQLNDMLASKDVVNGKFELTPGDPSLGQAPKYSNVGQEKMMDLLRKEFEQSGGQYSTGDINATMNALLAYLGKLR